jgi:hypothetical protein
MADNACESSLNQRQGNGVWLLVWRKDDREGASKRMNERTNGRTDGRD